MSRYRVVVRLSGKEKAVLSGATVPKDLEPSPGLFKVFRFYADGYTALELEISPETTEHETPR